jgi:hypothetical protein
MQFAVVGLLRDENSVLKWRSVACSVYHVATSVWPRSSTDLGRHWLWHVHTGDTCIPVAHGWPSGTEVTSDAGSLWEHRSLWSWQYSGLLAFRLLFQCLSSRSVGPRVSTPVGCSPYRCTTEGGLPRYDEDCFTFHPHACDFYDVQTERWKG